MNFLYRIYAYLSGRRTSCLPEESERARRGKLGEDLAAKHCKKVLGYRMVVRNWTYKKDEIDLICLDGPVLVFVEVRARSDRALVSGYHSVDRRKKTILRRACSNYLRQLDHPPKNFRFDIVEVTFCKEDEYTIRHYANVPLFHKHFSV